MEFIQTYNEGGAALAARKGARCMSRCRSCGAEILWIKTGRGKMMPVDAKTERFYPDQYGERLYVMNDGHTMRGTPAPEGEKILPNVASGHTSYFATCPDASTHRKTSRRP